MKEEGHGRGESVGVVCDCTKCVVAMDQFESFNKRGVNAWLSQFCVVALITLSLLSLIQYE